MKCWELFYKTGCWIEEVSIWLIHVHRTLGKPTTKIHCSALCLPQLGFALHCRISEQVHTCCRIRSLPSHTGSLSHTLSHHHHPYHSLSLPPIPLTPFNSLSLPLIIIIIIPLSHSLENPRNPSRRQSTAAAQDFAQHLCHVLDRQWCEQILTLLHTSSGIPMNAVLFFGAFYFCCSAGCRGELQYEAVGWSNVVAGSFQVDAFCIALHCRGWSSGGWTSGGWTSRVWTSGWSVKWMNFTLECICGCWPSVASEYEEHSSSTSGWTWIS